MLKEQILSELPGLIQDVQDGINDCKARLQNLGGPRPTVKEQRRHLLRLSRTFSSLVKHAVEGIYTDSFFDDPMSDRGYEKRLRAVISNALLAFADDLRLKGRKTKIVDQISGNPPYIEEPEERLRSDVIDEVENLMRRTRGSELVGTFNPQIIGELFYQESSPWQAIVGRYAEQIVEAFRTTLRLVLEDTADEQTSEGILRNIINPAVEPLQRAMEAKVFSILRHHQGGHPTTYNHYFTDNIQKARHDHRKKLLSKKVHAYFAVTENDPDFTGTVLNRNVNLKSLIESLAADTEANMDKYACSEALDCMEAYYKVSYISVGVLVGRWGESSRNITAFLTIYRLH